MRESTGPSSSHEGKACAEHVRKLLGHGAITTANRYLDYLAHGGPRGIVPPLPGLQVAAQWCTRRPARGRPFVCAGRARGRPCPVRVRPTGIAQIRGFGAPLVRYCA
jgi:hypothetical protein